jgi:hypothetical protein
MSTQLTTTNTLTPPVPPPVASLKLEPPTFAELLTRALSEPGSLMQAYSVFHPYSFANQLLAAFQCGLRGIPTGPINTFPGWKSLGRSVKKGEKALTLCMPITVKRRNAALDDDQDSDESFATFFVYKRRWFVLSQTEGPDIEFPPLPNWDASLALHNLEITQVPFTKPNGNCQGYARGREIAINPVAQLPRKTLFHETGHLCCLRSYVVLRGQVVWNEAPAGSGLYITFPPGTYRSPLLLAGLSGLTFHAVEEK